MSRALSAENSSISSFYNRFFVELFKNWRLTLLGITGVVLSVASGWTTFDGMTNFTGNVVLSLLITFGIQGVMLVTAWLIGESFATNATGKSVWENKTENNLHEWLRRAFYLVAVIIFMFGCAWFLAKYVLQYDVASSQLFISEKLFWVLILLGSLFIVALFLVLFSNAEIIGPYARGTRIILSNIPLWVMFLFCMATSVFFSFDSLFSSIFPADERKRASELRVEGQITGLIADLDTVIRKQRDELSSKLFASKSWIDYENDMSQLASAVRMAPDAIEEQALAKLRTRQSALAEEQEKLSGARSRQSNLFQERKRVDTKISSVDEQLSKQRNYIDNLEEQKRTKLKEIAEKRAAAEAEAKGAGETGRIGRGPIFRELNKTVTRIDLEIQAIDEQLRAAGQSFDALDTHRIALSERLVTIERDRARLLSQEQSAQESIKLRQELQQESSGTNYDMYLGLQLLEQELNNFRQQPQSQALANIQKSCTSLVQVINKIEVLKSKVGNIDCNPFESGGLSGQIFSMNANLLKYQSICGKEALLPKNTDALLGFGQQCILVSGLQGTDTQPFRLLLNRMALNRDDKAHRFVVTWNSFSDGNRLSYLALIIAIAIDSLVFMTGLFGASAIVSPLADSPRARNRSVARLEEIVDNALLPDKARSAELMAGVIKPIMDENNEGFIAQIDLSELSPVQDLQIRKIITAGAVLGLIKQKETASLEYLIRSELVEYIASVRAREERYSVHSYSNSVIQKEGESALTNSNRYPRQIYAKKSAPKQLAKGTKNVASRPVSYLRIQDSRTDNERVREAYLNALDINETALDQIGEINPDNLPDEWQIWFDDNESRGISLSQSLDQTRAQLGANLSDTANHLKKGRTTEENWVRLVDETLEEFSRQISSIAIYKVYQKSRKRAEQARSQYNQLSDKVDNADDELARNIYSLIDNLDDALKNKIDGWQSLEKCTSDLEDRLVQLIQSNRMI